MLTKFPSSDFKDTERYRTLWAGEILKKSSLLIHIEQTLFSGDLTLLSVYL